jgi:nitrogen fixation-related uncharacterized protein
MKKIPYATIIVCLSIVASFVAANVYFGHTTMQKTLYLVGTALVLAAVIIGAIFLAVKYDSDRNAL